MIARVSHFAFFFLFAAATFATITFELHEGKTNDQLPWIEMEAAMKLFNGLPDNEVTTRCALMKKHLAQRDDTLLVLATEDGAYVGHSFLIEQSDTVRRFGMIGLRSTDQQTNIVVLTGLLNNLHKIGIDLENAQAKDLMCAIDRRHFEKMQPLLTYFNFVSVAVSEELVTSLVERYETPELKNHIWFERKYSGD